MKNLPKAKGKAKGGEPLLKVALLEEGQVWLGVGVEARIGVGVGVGALY